MTERVERMCRIVVTGGPGAGKTSVWRAFADACGERVVAVPEVATQLLTYVFPSIRSAAQRCAVQHTIFHVQRNLESFHASQAGACVLFCDRGTPDGGGYWPSGHADFFAAMSTDWDTELSRYDAVLFLETAAAAGLSIASDNTARTEDLQTALEIDRRLHAVWSRHPNFHHVPVEREFASKVQHGLQTLHALLAEVECRVR